MKKLYKFLLIIIMLFPLGVAAESEYSLEMYNLLSKDRKLKITSISTLPVEYLNGSNGTVGGVDAGYDVEFSDVIQAYIDNLESIKNYRKNHSDRGLKTDVFCKSYTNCGILFKDEKYNYTYDEILDTEYPNPYMVHFDVDIKVEKSLNKDIYKYIGDKFPSFFADYYSGENDKFYLYDMAYINQLLNLTGGASSFLDIGAGSENAMLAFPEIKEAYEENPKMQLVYSNEGAVGDSLVNFEFKDGYAMKGAHFITYYYNVAYGVNFFEFYISPIIFVSDDVGTSSVAKIEAAKNRIEEYIDNSNISFTITDKSSNYSSDEKTNINNNLSQILKNAVNENISVSGNNIYELKIGNVTTKIFIVSVSDEFITTHEVKSFEKVTGIRIASKSADVPLDSSLRIADVTGKYSDDKSIISAFDINIYSYYKNGYIKNTSSGIKVMIPVGDGFDTNGKSVYYIDEDGNKESIDYKLETIDNKKYITFTTNHFSVYSIAQTIADKTDEDIKDPDEIATGDALIYTVWLIGFGALAYSIYYFIKQRNYV